MTLPCAFLSTVLAITPLPTHGVNTPRVPVLRTLEDAVNLPALRTGEATRIAVPVENGTINLDMTRFETLTPGAAVVEVGGDGVERPIDLSDLVLLKGTIAGDPDSLAFLSYMPDGQVAGFVRSVEGVRVLSSGLPGHEQIASRLASELNLGDGTPFCGVIDEDPRFYPDGRVPATEPVGEATPRGTAPCRAARVAIDSDYEFSRIFGSNTALSSAYAVTLLAASSTIYERDVNVRLVVPYVRVWATNNDPYVNSSNGMNGFLDELRDHWNTAMRHIPRETVHGLSGRSLGGGLAYVNALCSGTYAYGVSANLGGFFPLPVQDNSNQNWDLMVVSHELGHNFGTGHTHDINSYNPVIDGCGNGDCTNALHSTIMSYCHLCSGGLGNVDMRFHPRVQTSILNYLDNAACDLTTGDVPVAENDSFTGAIAGTPIDLDVLSNDAASSCTAQSVTLVSHDTVSSAGGTITDTTGSPFNIQRLVYTPPANFSGVDSFDYTSSAGSAHVTVQVATLMPASQGGTEPGVDVDYYVLNNPQQLPNFATMTPYASDVVADINFASTEGDFATSGRADNVGAVFEGMVEVPTSGWYTISTESDDGSRAYVDDALVANNNGLHGMQEVGGVVPLAAGKHHVRVEFFENSVGAGLIVRYTGQTLNRQPVPANAWTRIEPCVADLAEPYGTLNFFDVAAFLGYYNLQDPAADLAEPFDTFNFFDVSAFLGAYNAGCP